MTSGIQFQSRVDWRWPKASGFFLVLSGVAIVLWGPGWTFGFSSLGLLISFAGFLQSLNARKDSPPLWAPVLLALFHAAFMGLALVLYVLFIWPSSDQAVPALASRVVDPSGRLIVWIPADWQASSVPSGDQTVMVLKPRSTEEWTSLNEIKVVLKSTTATGEAKEPQPNTFTVKKFWFTFHQVTVVGFKGPQALCSVATTVLPPHLPMAQDLCKALFKNIEVPATIDP